MSEALSQNQRLGQLTTALGDDVLTLARFNAVEAISELFEYQILAVSEQKNVDFNGALGLPVSVKLQTPGGGSRYFCGLLTEARWSGQSHDLYAYQLVVRPWTWLLTRTSDCRIFPNMTPPDIIKQVFTDRGFSDYRDALTGSYPTLEYTVQYRETDFAFVSRLMEEYGIYYFFEYPSQGMHKLVLADAKSSSTNAPGNSTIPFNPQAEGGRSVIQHFERWTRGRSLQSGDFVLNDYDYNKPSSNLLAESDKPGGYAHDAMEMYDFPGDYTDRGEGQTLAKVRAEAVQSLDDRRTALGHAPELSPGMLCTLKDQPVDEENKEYLVVRASHFLDAQAYRSSGGVDQGRPYVGNYELTPSATQFRAQLLTPDAVVRGVQSALVVGKQGEEIDVDEQGRICVQFYWDRKKKPSRRVRVAQQWAGGQRRGFQFIPRIGDEVLIQYIEGDPDRPLVIGSVYNGAHETPWALPSLKNRSGIRSDSTKGHSGHHVIGFDDTAGSEEMYLRAQKDLTFKVLNNEQRTILNSQTEQVGGDETITVGDMTIGAQQLGGNFTLNALKTVTINVGPSGAPLTQILMDTHSITLNIGPGGSIAQIAMGPAGVTISGTPLSQLMVQPAGISTSTPMMNLMAQGPITFVSPMVTIPTVTIGAGTCSGLPII